MNFTQAWKRLLLVLVAILVAMWGLPRLSSSWHLHHRQAELLTAIEQHQSGRLEQLVSPDYADQWNFTWQQIHSSMEDVSAQFLSLVIVEADPQWILHGKTADHSARLTLKGIPATPFGTEMVSRAAKLQQPFTFTWKKESFWPWSWRLIRVANEELHLDSDYRPGMLSGSRDHVSY